MSNFRRYFLSGAAALVVAAAGTAFIVWPEHDARADNPAITAAPAATPVSVAVVEARDAQTWDEFSGRLEAVDRVDIRSRVAGSVLAVHFREGALVKEGDALITIDPAPYEAEIQRLQGELAAAKARVSLAKREQDRGEQLQKSNSGAISDSIVDQRRSAYLEAAANQVAAEAALQAAQLNLGYTSIRAPVAGRIGKLEVTTGNLVAAGPGSPVLTTLVSVNPIYVSFNADEGVVMRALKSLGEDPTSPTALERIPVEIDTASYDEPLRGRLQLIDNQVDVGTGTVRMRAVFDNAEGRLMAGQFARVRMGQAKAEPVLIISDRAVGTDQDKKFVMVVDAENKAIYREVKLGPHAGGLRIVTSGLKPGERIIVNGLQRVRPGALVEPQAVPMEAQAMHAQSEKTKVAER